jgi:hypothetical protein
LLASKHDGAVDMVSPPGLMPQSVSHGFSSTHLFDFLVT